MKIPLILAALIIFMGESECYVIGNVHDNKAGGEQRILLRKLQNIRQNATKSEPETASWNMMLAEALVNRINIIIPFRETDKNPPLRYTNGETRNGDFLTNCLSRILLFYKEHVYDKLFGPQPPNPKNEVELIGPKYGKIRECPDGQMEDREGNCVSVKSAPFILSIPFQCPIGYRRDRLGRCREVF